MNSTISRIILDIKDDLSRINQELDDMNYAVFKGIFDPEDINVLIHMIEIFNYDVNELKEEINKEEELPDDCSLPCGDHE